MPYSRPVQAAVQLEMFITEIKLPRSAFFSGNHTMFLAPGGFKGVAGASTMVPSQVAKNVGFVQANGPYYRRRELGARYR